MTHSIDRRRFMQGSAAIAAGLAVSTNTQLLAQAEHDHDMPFKISLAEWSLHRTLNDGKMDNLDFAKTAQEDFNIEAIEFSAFNIGFQANLVRMYSTTPNISNIQNNNPISGVTSLISLIFYFLNLHE